MASRVSDLYREALSMRLTFEEISERWNSRILQNPTYLRLPQYRKHAVRALFFFLFHGPADQSIYKHLEYRMLWIDGKYYAEFDAWRAQFPDADAGQIKTGVHFWKGTDKPYSAQEAING